ncbi:hypothetical protein K470DRAFT_289095 [Piedraia hortae CBS 480.64]|uniref:Uncharacterized protein n=1 Tax=Piedraia hortae CBS 480.64 TaxID=1314780 RepID=A0A6A7C738_9PEZI|nr:hypothetical protein K470DRAFT_289095 [Piedraia hortae CBS 480.64]
MGYPDLQSDILQAEGGKCLFDMMLNDRLKRQAFINSSLNNWNKAIQWFEKALTLLRKYDNTDPQSLVEATHHLSRAQLSLNMLTEAVKVFETTLRSFETHHGFLNLLTLSIANRLGYLYHTVGHTHDRAESMYKRTLNGFDQHNNHRGILKSCQHLDHFYLDQNKLSDASNMFSRALNLYRQLRMPQTTSSLLYVTFDYGVVKHLLGQVIFAERLMFFAHDAF